jgi:hypothetical protein
MKGKLGLRKELAIVIMFFVCILMAVYGLKTLGLIDDEDVSSYKNLENKLTSAAIDYYNNRYTLTTGDTMIITYRTLYNNGYIGKLIDSKGRECSGYAKIVNGSVGVSYINCPGYKSNGYVSDYE